MALYFCNCVLRDVNDPKDPGWPNARSVEQIPIVLGLGIMAKVAVRRRTVRTRVAEVSLM